MKVTVIGSHLCPDTLYALNRLAGAGAEVEFKDILSRLGVTEIEAMGQQFDPGLHNAVMRGEDETKGANEIVQELQKGFKLGDKVIRYAMVKVVNCD